MCHFANYLAELFARYLADWCHSNVRSLTWPSGRPLRSFDQLVGHLLQPVDLENSSHLGVKTRFRSRTFPPVTRTTVYAKYPAKIYAK